MELNILSRQNQLSDLDTYLNEVDTEVTMILQSLQWDRKHFLEQKTLVPCQYNANHRVPPDKLMAHESGCFLKSQGYVETCRLLPSPVDPDATTLVKLNANSIAEIIKNASRYQALFKTVEIGPFGCDRLYHIIKGAGCSGKQPLTLDRLQSTYTADERRAIHDAVVAHVPSCHDLSDLELMSVKDESKEAKPKSRLEILAELRDMKRRRTKYRVAAKTRNYSDVLRDVINTQMELYTQAQDNLIDRIKKEKVDIKDEVTEGHRPNDKDAASSQISKATEDTYSKVRHHENRKRRHNVTYDTNNTARCSKTVEGDKTTTSKNYDYRDNISHASNSKRKDYSASNRRDDRHTKYSRTNRDKYDDDYERRKRQRDKNGDNRRETYSKRHSPSASKNVNKGKGQLSKEDSTRSTDKKTYEDRHHTSKGHYLNIPRETQKDDQHEPRKLKRPNNAARSNVEKHCYSDNSYSSDDNESQYTEKSEMYDKSKETHHNYKASYSKVKKEREIHCKGFQNNKNGHGRYNQNDNYQVEGNIVIKKEENISEDESHVSDYSKGGKSRPYHGSEKSFKEYDTYEKSNTKKYRDNDEYKNIEYEKDDTYRRQKRNESEKRYRDKHGIHIKEELDSSEDDQDDRTDVLDNYHHSSSSSYKYHRYDKNYSKSHKGKAQKRF